MINRLVKISWSFCAKKGNYFWTEINPNVKEAEYAVRGIVPTLANNMKLEIQRGKTGMTLSM
jgi:hypothetical protein